MEKDNPKDNRSMSSLVPTSSGSSMEWRGIGLSNMMQSEIAPCLPLPFLPVFFGASDEDLRLLDDSVSSTSARDFSPSRSEILAQSAKIADMLRETDVSYLNLREDRRPIASSHMQYFELYDRVLECNPEAFEFPTATQPTRARLPRSTICESKPTEQHQPVLAPARRDESQQHINNSITDVASSSKSKVKKKARDHTSRIIQPDPIELDSGDAVLNGFCKILEEFCARAEILSDEQDVAEWSTLSLDDVRLLLNKILSVHSKRILNLVPVDILERTLWILDHQVHQAEGLSMVEYENCDSSVIFCALESIHAALSLMSHVNMPKQVYKEEVIERILEFSKRQLADVMYASDPVYGAFHKPSENRETEGVGDNDLEAQNGSARKKNKRDFKGSRERKSTSNKVSAAVNSILHKLCTVLALLKDLLLIERVSDSCILQLIKTSFTMLLVDNIQLLQLKAIGLVSGIFHSYAHHRTYIIDELVHVLWKLRFSKRAMRAYHLPDEEQVQIQMITALLIQLVHCSARLPEALRQASCGNSLLDISLDAGYPMRCYEAAVETCCLFWTRVLQRFTTIKAPDASELKVVLENLVADILATLNLPEYPSSSPILEVLCVMLLQNAGLKSKDISVRSLSIDLLGSIAARLKHDAVMCSKNKFWVLHKLEDGGDADLKIQKDLCRVCLGRKDEKALLLCRGCHRLFHVDCAGEQDAPRPNWQCQVCVGKKQLLALRSYSRLLCKSEGAISLSADPVAEAEIVQQMILNYLQNGVSGDDIHVFVCWFYVCTWHKNYPESEEKLIYILLKVKSNLVVRDSAAAAADSMLARDSIKKLTLALGQNSSFSRGFDKIFHMLLASLRENSPVIRAKALRSVSIIVEADPEVLCDKHVQSAVEGRFCDSSISVREAALELVSRHMASHPDVGLKYFEKVAERIKDTGLSVRKRAIKIIRDLCTSNARFSEHTTAFFEIISRVSDDESSIQDLVCKTFYEFWFEEPALQTKIYGDGSSVPLELAKKTEQIVELLRRMPSHQFLVSVIKRNLALDFYSRPVKAAGINPVSLAAVRKRCELMCKCLLERILQVEETNSEEGEVHTLPYVLVLHAFCVVDPLLCAPASDPSQFVVTLEPYLKTQVDNRSVAQLLESIIFIIDSVLPLIRKFPQNVVDELEQDLKHMIVRHPFLTVVHACIKCLCSLSRITGKGASVVEHLLLVFFKRLDAQGIDNKQLLGRSLFCIGLLVRYGNCLLSNSGTRKIDVGSSVRLFRKYLGIDDFSIKTRSLQALGFLLIARPKYMLEKEIRKIIEAALSAGSDACLKLQALQNIYEYLLDSEGQLGKEKSSSNVVSGHIEGGHGVPTAAGAGDSNACGGIIQLYWNTILERCLDVNEQVRQTSLKIMEIVLRQGLVHPITCVPYLIALEMDPLELNSKLAHHLLANMNDKYPAFFESRLGDGFQLSFLFVQSVREASHENSNQKVQQSKATGNLERITRVGSLAHAKLGVSQIYRLIRGNRVSRNRFMFSVVRKFDNLRWSTSLPAFLLYCAEVLVLLPFTSLDEPLYLIYAINRVVQVRAGVVEANMKGHLLELQQRNVHKIQNRNKEIQPGPPFDLNRTEKEESADCRSRATARDDTSSDESCCISGEEEQTIWADWIAMTALSLLLKLKRHLKIVYSLNDARCMAFTPNTPQKPGESFSRQSTPFQVGETLTSMPATHQDLAQRYHEFKNALKEDSMDYAAYTASIKRKRSTPTKMKLDQTADKDGNDESTVQITSSRKRPPS